MRPYRLFPLPIAALDILLVHEAGPYFTLVIREARPGQLTTAVEPDRYEHLSYEEAVDVIAATLDGCSGSFSDA